MFEIKFEAAIFSPCRTLAPHDLKEEPRHTPYAGIPQTSADNQMKSPSVALSSVSSQTELWAAWNYVMLCRAKKETFLKEANLILELSFALLETSKIWSSIYAPDWPNLG